MRARQCQCLRQDRRESLGEWRTAGVEEMPTAVEVPSASIFLPDQST